MSLRRCSERNPGLKSPARDLGARLVAAPEPPVPLGHDLEHALGVDAGLLGEGQGVGVAHHAGGQGDLVAELGRLAAARLVEVEAAGREGLEHGQDGAACSSVAPMMSVRVPSIAPCSPPVTGQSKACLSSTSAARGCRARAAGSSW